MTLTKNMNICTTRWRKLRSSSDTSHHHQCRLNPPHTNHHPHHPHHPIHRLHDEQPVAVNPCEEEPK